MDPTKRLVARELERRWELALQYERQFQRRLDELDASTPVQAQVDREDLLALAQDLPTVWNSPKASARLKQLIVRTLIHEVIVDLDDESKVVVLVIHWHGGRHSEVRVAHPRMDGRRSEHGPSAVEVLQKLGGQWSDRQLAVTMNRMRCKSEMGTTWTAVGVKVLRERLGVPAFDPISSRPASVSADEAAWRLSICVGSVHRLIRERVLPATQLMPSAPWQIPLAALDSEAVKISVRAVKQRRPRNFGLRRDRMTPYLPGIASEHAE